MDKLHLEIVTPDGLVFSNDIKSVVLPGSEGEFGVLPGHASLISLLKAGVIDIESEDKSHDAVAINWGYAEINESEIANSLQKAKDLIASMSSENNAMAATVAKLDSMARTR